MPVKKRRELENARRLERLGRARAMMEGGAAAGDDDDDEEEDDRLLLGDFCNNNFADIS